MPKLKKAEWQLINEAHQKTVARRTAELRTARLARDAELPPPAEPVRRRKKSAPA